MASGFITCDASPAYLHTGNVRSCLFCITIQSSLFCTVISLNSIFPVFRQCHSTGPAFFLHFFSNVYLMIYFVVATLLKPYLLLYAYHHLFCVNHRVDELNVYKLELEQYCLSQMHVQCTVYIFQ